MVLPFFSIFFLILFIFVLEKSTNNDGGDENNHNEGQKKKYEDSHHEEEKNDENNHDEGEAKNNQNNHNKEEKKKDEKGRVMTKTFKLNCQSCIDKIQNLVSELEGEMELSVDVEKDLVFVNGIMNDIGRLRATLRGPVEIVPPKKYKDGEKDEKGSVTTTVFKF